MKENTHIVIKREDAYKYLTDVELKTLERLLENIRTGRHKEGKPLNTYYVCNTDEPYSHIVRDIILLGERN